MNEKDYMDIQLNRDINLFKWKGKNIQVPRDPEFYTATMGVLGFDLIRKRWVRGNFTGILDDLGDFETFIALPLSTTNEGAIELKNHSEIIVCRNNPLCLPNNAQNAWFSHLKAENDKSLLIMILLTRLNKALKVYTDQQKKQIEEAFKNIKDGLPVIFTSSLIEDLEVMELTSPEYIDKMQYLSGIMSEIDKREANLKGIDLEVLDKRAQVTSNELKQYDDITTLDYMIRFNERMRFVEEMKENGYEIEIIRNPIFFDEPTEEDADEGTFEVKEEEELPEETPEENKEEEEETNEENTERD